MSLTVAAYQWGNKYSPDDVRRLQRMVKRYMTVRHTFAVITDKSQAFDADRDIHAIQMDMTTHIPGKCFAKLFTFHHLGGEIFGERILQIDLDSIIVGPLDPLVDRDEDLVMWRNPSRIPWDNPTKPGRCFYNTSLVLHRCGTMPWLRDAFDPTDPRCRDDQWWLSSLLGPDMPYWDGSDGVYRLGRDDTPGSGVNGVLPENARIVTFPGSEGKWTEGRIREANPWIEEHLPNEVAGCGWSTGLREERIMLSNMGRQVSRMGR